MGAQPSIFRNQIYFNKRSLCYGDQLIYFGEQLIATQILVSVLTIMLHVTYGWIQYRDKIYQCMMSTQELVGIQNDAAHKSWSKYTTDNKVGKVN